MRIAAAPRITIRTRFIASNQSKLLGSGLEIALPRGHIQFRAPDAHFDGVIVLAAVRFLRSESDGVHIPSLFGDRRIKARQFVFARGVKRIATGGGCVLIHLSRSVLNDRAADWTLMSDGNRKQGDIGEKQGVQSFVE